MSDPPPSDPPPHGAAASDRQRDGALPAPTTDGAPAGSPARTARRRRGGRSGGATRAGAGTARTGAEGAGAGPETKASGGSNAKGSAKGSGGSNAKGSGGSNRKPKAAAKGSGGSNRSSGGAQRSAGGGARSVPRAPAPATPEHRARPEEGTGTVAHEAADRENTARLAANRRRVRELIAIASTGPALVVGVVVGVLAGPVVGAAVAVAALAALAVVVWRGALDLSLRRTGGRRTGPDELPSLANQVDGLCATIGVARPELWVLEDVVPNACALDGPGSPGVLLVTSGLVEDLDLIEMEGVLAHELVHLKRRDAVVSAVAVATVGTLCAVTGQGRLLHRAVGAGREYDADQAAALAVRYPPGLGGALEVMARHGRGAGRPAQAARGPGAMPAFAGRRWAATRWIWIDPMVGEDPAATGGELDATTVRRDALAQW